LHGGVRDAWLKINEHRQRLRTRNLSFYTTKQANHYILKAYLKTNALEGK